MLCQVLSIIQGKLLYFTDDKDFVEFYGGGVVSSNIQ